MWSPPDMGRPQNIKLDGTEMLPSP